MIKAAFFGTLLVAMFPLFTSTAGASNWVDDAATCRQKLACSEAMFAPKTGDHDTAPTASYYGQLCGPNKQTYFSGPDGLYQLYQGKTYHFHYPASTSTLPSAMENGFRTYYMRADIRVSKDVVSHTVIKLRRYCTNESDKPNCPYAYFGYASTPGGKVKEAFIPKVSGTPVVDEEAKRETRAQLGLDIDSVKTRYQGYATSNGTDISETNSRCAAIRDAYAACESVPDASIAADVARSFSGFGSAGCGRPPVGSAGPVPATDVGKRALCADELRCIDQNARSSQRTRTVVSRQFFSPFKDEATGIAYCESDARVRTFDTDRGEKRLLRSAKHGTYIMRPDGKSYFVELNVRGKSGSLKAANGQNIGFPFPLPVSTPALPGEVGPNGSPVRLVRVTSPYLSDKPIYLKVYLTTCGPTAPRGCVPTYNSLGVLNEKPKGIKDTDYLPPLFAEPVTETRSLELLNHQISRSADDLSQITQVIQKPESEANSSVELIDDTGTWKPKSGDRKRTAFWRGFWTVAARNNYCSAASEALASCQGSGAKLDTFAEGVRSLGCQGIGGSGATGGGVSGKALQDDPIK